MHLGAASEESDSGSVTPLRHSKECIETVCARHCSNRDFNNLKQKFYIKGLH